MHKCSSEQMQTTQIQIFFAFAQFDYDRPSRLMESMVTVEYEYIMFLDSHAFNLGLHYTPLIHQFLDCVNWK